MRKADITVIGSGPGGYVAAIRAAQIGASVILVEKGKIGGTCLNYGCIPTKVLYKSAVLMDDLKKSSNLGIEVGEKKINFDKIMSRKEKTIKRLTDGVKYLLKQNGVKIIRGEAKITGKNTVKVLKGDCSEIIRTDYIVIATGTAPLIPPIKGIDNEGVLSSRELLELNEIPPSLAVIGGGVVGVEFASIFSSLGSKVYIVEKMPQLLPVLDEEIAVSLEEELSKQGVTIYTDSPLSSISKRNGRLRVKSGDKEFPVTNVLLSLGRKVILPEVNEELSIARNADGTVKVNSYLQTNIDNIYAIGDINGKYQLAHVASEEGIVAVNNIMGKREEMDYKVVPNVVFSLPEIASVGLTEQEARQKCSIKVGKFPYTASGKALSLGEERGFIKIIADSKWREILGVHIFGYDASTLIAEAGIALKLEATVEEIAKTIHAHPTLPEMIKEACEDIEFKAIHNI